MMETKRTQDYSLFTEGEATTTTEEEKVVVVEEEEDWSKFMVDEEEEGFSRRQGCRPSVARQSHLAFGMYASAQKY